MNIIWVTVFSSAPYLSNIEVFKYFSYKDRFNGVYPREKLPRIKDRVYVNLVDKQSEETHQASLFVDKNIAVYFDSFSIEYIFLKKY